MTDQQPNPTPSWIPQWLRDLSDWTTRGTQQSMADISGLTQQVTGQPMSPEDFRVLLALGMAGEPSGELPTPGFGAGRTKFEADDPSGGLWFLDGNKPTYAMSHRAHAEQHLGSRVGELDQYPSITTLDPSGRVPQTVWDKPGEEVRAKDLTKTYSEGPGPRTRENLAAYWRRSGWALGYAKADIERYVTHMLEQEPPGWTEDLRQLRRETP